MDRKKRVNLGFRQPVTMKRILLLPFVLVLSITFALSQPCIVKIDSLKGQYTGDCRNGKANGFGTATGVDSYTGNFKDGYPDGEGKYSWKNGTWYNGGWKAGLFDGNGTYNKVDQNKPDSATLVTGYWKAGKYIGKFQKPYSFTALTGGINDLNGRKIRDQKAEITIAVKSTTAGASSIYKNILPKPKLVSVELTEGLFQQRADNETAALMNIYTFRNVTFPFQAILSFETTGTNPLPSTQEKIKIEISETGSWYIQVNIDN